MSDDTRPIAFFDFDGTLTKGDTLMPFLRFVVGNPRYYSGLLKLSPVFAAYFLKLMSNDRAKQRVLTEYLSGYSVEELFRLGDLFSKQIIPGMLRPSGMERFRWHKEEGHMCVLVSASLDLYLERWAKDNSFFSVICSSMEVSEGKYVTGNIKGGNCSGREKVIRIKSQLENLSKRVKYAYGNSKGDFEMLEFCDHSFYLNKGSFSEI